MLFIDVDNFKLVNGSLGHAAGDELLRGIAERVRQALRADDVIGRLGGDEFLVLCHDVRSDKDAMSVAGRLIAAMEPPFKLADREVYASVSIGVALTGPEMSAQDLMAAADTAAYEAKGNGRDRSELFD